MNKKDVLQLLQENKGRNLSATWRREVKVRKGVIPLIEKETQAVIRTGINFANLSAVKVGIQEGERKEVQELQWGEWEIFPYFILHKGIEYLRLYPSSATPFHYKDEKAVCDAEEDRLQKPKVKWFCDGREVSYSFIEEYLLASEKIKPIEETPICFTIKFRDLVELK